MKQLKFIQVPKQWHMLDNWTSERMIYSHKNLFLTQYLTLNRLLKLNFSFYYKYNYNLNNFIKKCIYLNHWRLRVNPYWNFTIFTPIYKFSPHIQLKEYLFFKSFQNTSNLKYTITLNKQSLRLTPYLAFKTKTFSKKLPGGFNSFLITKANTLVNKDMVKDNTCDGSLLYKHTFFYKNQYKYLVLFDILNLIFFLFLSNIILFYQQIIWNVLYRL